MDALRFDRLARDLASMPTRRTMLGLGTAGLLGALGLDDAAAKKKYKNKKKCKKKCGPCAKCKKGKCKAKPAGTSCGTGKQCFAKGTCVACDVCANDCLHATLKEALEDAADGATIHICSGSYPTNATIVGKKLTVIGAGAGTGGTVLDGQGRSKVLFLSETTLDMRHLTITGGSAVGGSSSFGGGIAAFDSVLTLEEVQITGNEAEGGGGIYAIGCEEVTLIDSRVTDNSAETGGGIYNLAGPLWLTAGSIVTGNTASISSGAGGIANDLGGTVEILGGSRVSDNHPVDCVGTTAC